MENKVPLIEIVRVFLKLGVIGFGGPAAHIAMMHSEIVTKRNWLNEQQFLNLLGATQLIPGPNSTEMAIHIGYVKAGWKGLLLAGLCFILPAVLITGCFAYLYLEFGKLPEILPFIYGIKPAIIAIILGAVYTLAIKAVNTKFLGFIGIIALIASLLNVNEVYIMFASGLLAVGYYFYSNIKNKSLNSIAPFALLPFTQVHLTNYQLFLTFLKIGAILYGSGYVLFAFLDTELVAKGYLSRTVLIDAIAVGQFTPGPVFSSVTFIGYQINGFWGAFWATIAIFLPSFLFVAGIHFILKKVDQSKVFKVFLNAVNVASVAIILAVCFKMGKETITDWRTVLIAILSAFVVFYLKKINSAFIVLGGAILGYFLYFL